MGSKALGFTVEQENLIWDLHRHGESLGEIERVLGVTMPRIRRFLRESGHLEGDLVFGARPSAVATLVNRQTRAVHVVALPDGYRAETVADALIAHLGRPPAHLRRSLTWDRGREMAEHERITAAPRHARLLLRPASSMATRDERKYERVAASVPAQER